MKIKYYFTFFLLGLITACSKEKKQIINTASDQTFPDKVGDHWVYKYDDLNSNGKQYIYVDIVGTTTLPDGESATIWTSTLQDKSNTKYLIDSSYVTVDDQKAVFYAPPRFGLNYIREKKHSSQ